jgi:hypothetical protein
VGSDQHTLTLRSDHVWRTQFQREALVSGVARPPPNIGEHRKGSMLACRDPTVVTLFELAKALGVSHLVPLPRDYDSLGLGLETVVGSG